MKEYSEVTQRWYEPDDCVFYRNGYQAAFMLTKPDCMLMDMFEDKGKLVFAFPRRLHKKYIREWHEREHEMFGDRQWRRQ